MAREPDPRRTVILRRGGPLPPGGVRVTRPAPDRWKYLDGVDPIDEMPSPPSGGSRG